MDGSTYVDEGGPEGVRSAHIKREEVLCTKVRRTLLRRLQCSQGRARMTSQEHRIWRRQRKHAST